MTKCNDITKPLSEASTAVNQYASRRLIGYAASGSTLLSPRVKEWHEWAKSKSGLYAETIRVLDDKVFKSDVYRKIKMSAMLTDDIDRKQLADLTTVANTIAQENYEILDTAMPKLEKLVEKEIKNSKRRENIDTLFGKIGLMKLHEVSGLIQRLQNGEDLDVLIKELEKDKRAAELGKKLATYMLDREAQSVINSGGNKRASALATLYALKANNSQLHKEMMSLINNHNDLYMAIHDVALSVHEFESKVQRGGKVKYDAYDEGGTLDVYDTALEFKFVTEREYMEMDQYKGAGNWKVIRKPGKQGHGIVARKSTGSFMEGLVGGHGRIKNGIQLSKEMVDKAVEDSKLERSEWIKQNNVVADREHGKVSYRVILNKNEFKLAGGKQSIAQTLYRSYVHNKGLIEIQKAKEMVVSEMTYHGQEGVLGELEARIKSNKKRKDKVPVKPFISTDVEWATVEKEFPEIAEMYVKVSDLSSYGGFNKEINYVRRDMKDMIIGHQQGLLFKDNHPSLQKWEQVYKELVQMLKIKLVVANPAKLAMDAVSNFGVLMTMDVSPFEAYKYSKEAVELADNMGLMRSELVKRRLELEFAKIAGRDTKRLEQLVEVQQKKIENDPYYDALKYGFVQSMGTEMMIKEFDTISGLQHTIDSVVEKIVKDGDGNPNEIHKALVWWMKAGFELNDVLDYAGKMNKLKGTRFSNELMEISGRLKDKKQTEDTVKYVSEFIAAPSSEVVRQGSRAMQMADAMARWAMFRARVESGVSKDDAAIEALDTFIDYRLNVPQEIKELSDYGVLMFPSFWLRAQKIIWNMFKYHPLSAGGGFITADILELNGASFVDVNIISKAIEGHLFHMGQDVVQAKTLFLGA